MLSLNRESVWLLLLYILLHTISGIAEISMVWLPRNLAPPPCPANPTNWPPQGYKISISGPFPADIFIAGPCFSGDNIRCAKLREPIIPSHRRFGGVILAHLHPFLLELPFEPAGG
ncbi:hypothetical protein K440DRAFT_396422 [Wilcoxina mikolae CBS 423.85]|nr:hypothetical protein K440DRAFT_396422 [Wilcoxina mikolae CBS 423.85]